MVLLGDVVGMTDAADSESVGAVQAQLVDDREFRIRWSTREPTRTPAWSMTLPSK
jgi:hypothetical protein